MTEKEQVEFIIRHLGFMGATHTLRVPKLRVLRFLEESDSFTVNIKRHSAKTIKHINLIKSGNKAHGTIESLWYRKNQ